MMTWSDLKAKTKKNEMLCLCAIVIVLAGGVIEELVAQFGKPLLFVLNFDSVTLTVLSVQATVSTLVITILSLMTNKMDTAYMGVSINDFLLNIKPCLFKQKRIIIVEIILIVANAFFQMLRWYNFVVTVFIVSMCFLIISIQEIYEAFLGTEKINDEIKAYLKDKRSKRGSGKENDAHADQDKKVNNKTFSSTQKLSDLCDQWKKEISLQSEPEYQDYLDVFNFLFSYAFSTDKDREELLKKSVELSHALLSTQSESAVLRGIDFIDNCYTQAWLYIKDNKKAMSKSGKKFTLFDEVYEDVLDAFPYVNMDKLEEKFLWLTFSETVIQDALFMSDYFVEEKNSTTTEQNTEAKDSESLKTNKDDEFLKNSDIQAIEDFCYYLGDYISSDAIMDINEDVWSEPFESLRTRFFAYPDKIKLYANKAVATCYFNFMISQVRNGYYEIIRIWYRDLGASLHVNTDDEFIYTAVKLHCYIYYLAFYETNACVDQSIIDAAKGFIEDKEVGNCFSYFIGNIAESDINVFKEPAYNGFPHDIFNAELAKRLRTELRRYEFMAKYGAKRLCMDDVTQDFVTFLSCYIGNDFHDYDVLDSIISEDDASSYYLRYVQENRCSDLNQFFHLMGINENVVVINTDEEGVTTSKKAPDSMPRAQAAYAVLRKEIEDKYKNYVLNEASAGKKFTDSEYDDQEKEASDKLIDYLKKSFCGLITEDIREDRQGNIFKRSGYQRYHIYKFAVFSDTDIVKLTTDFYDDFFNRIVVVIIDKLRDGNFLGIIDKKTKTDNEWIEYLEGCVGQVAIGSEPTLYTKDYRNQSKVREWLKNNEHYTNGSYGDALLVNKGSLKINFRDAVIDVHKETIQEAIGNRNVDPKTEKYRYEPSANMPVDFTEEELAQYLSDKRRIVDISLDIGIEIDAAEGEKIGNIIKME